MIVSITVVIVLVIIASVPFILMVLWNAILPGLFGLPAVTFWQSFGLIIIAKILFQNIPLKKNP